MNSTIKTCVHNNHCYFVINGVIHALISDGAQLRLVTCSCAQLDRLIVAIAIHPEKPWLACADEEKRIWIFSIEMETEGTMKAIFQTVFSMPKSIHVLQWSESPLKNQGSITLYVADKFGNVYGLEMVSTDSSTISKVKEDSDIKDEKIGSKYEPILGHIGPITSMLITGSWIYTADREEKIKKSHIKHPFIIDRYLLGHEEYISSMAFLCGRQYLVSVGGDDDMFIWNLKDARKDDYIDRKKSIELVSRVSIKNAYLKQMHLNMHNDIEPSQNIAINAIKVIVYESEHNTWIVVLLENCPDIFIWRWTESGAEFFQDLKCNLNSKESNEIGMIPIDIFFMESEPKKPLLCSFIYDRKSERIETSTWEVSGESDSRHGRWVSSKKYSPVNILDSKEGYKLGNNLIPKVSAWRKKFLGLPFVPIKSRAKNEEMDNIESESSSEE
jgi:WD40 repeat protein